MKTQSKLKYKSIGKNIQRRDVVGKITGDSTFCADIELNDSISLKALRSRRHHAVIENIDVTGAMKIPGVIKVFTARDIPGENLMGIINRDQPLLAHGKVRSKADPVALVAALTDDIALKA